MQVVAVIRRASNSPPQPTQTNKPLNTIESNSSTTTTDIRLNRQSNHTQAQRSRRIRERRSCTNRALYRGRHGIRSRRVVHSKLRARKNLNRPLTRRIPEGENERHVCGGVYCCVDDLFVGIALLDISMETFEMYLDSKLCRRRRGVLHNSPKEGPVPVWKGARYVICSPVQAEQ